MMTGIPAPGERRVRGWAPLAAALSLLAGIYVAAQTVWMVITCWNPLLFCDQWSEVISGRPITWSWLRSQHNEHRILFPRLLFLADRWLTSETNRLNYAANLIIQAALVVMMFHLGKRVAQDRVRDAWLAGICLALLFWAGQFQNFVWGFQAQFLGIVLAAAGTFAVLALGRPTVKTLAYTVSIETIAVYTLASGVAVPFLAIGLAIWLRRPRGMTLILAAAALLLLSSYLWGYQTPPGSGDPLSAWRHFASIIFYVLLVIGAPIGNGFLMIGLTQACIVVSTAAGLMGLWLFLRLVWGLLRKAETPPPAAAALVALAGFLLCMFGSIAVGRFGLGLGSALASRYTTPAVAYWCAIILVLAAENKRAPARNTGFMFLALPLPLLMAATEAANVSAAEHWVELRRAAMPAFLANVADLPMLALDWSVPPPDGPWQGSAAQLYGPRLRDAHSSVFAEPWANWLGTQLSAHVAVINPALCGGVVTGFTQVAATPSPGWRVIGRGWQRDGRAADKLLIVDAAGAIVGYGMGGIDLVAAGLAARNAGLPGDVGWIGDFSHAMPAGVKIYMLLEPGPAACPLGPWAGKGNSRP